MARRLPSTVVDRHGCIVVSGNTTGLATNCFSFSTHSSASFDFRTGCGRSGAASRDASWKLKEWRGCELAGNALLAEGSLALCSGAIISPELFHSSEAQK